MHGTSGGPEDDFPLKNVGGYFHGRFFLFNGVYDGGKTLDWGFVDNDCRLAD